MKQPKPEVGYNIQITKVCDIGGGHETVTINTAAEPGASAEAIYGKIKLIRQAMQKEIDFSRELEKRRAEQDHALYEKLQYQQGTRSPVDLPDPSDLNNHSPETPEA